MALNFPINPSNGDTYQGYVYDSTYGVWNADQGQIISRFSTSATEPSSPTQGDGWFNTDNRRTYVYHNGAWLESGKPVTFSETAPLNQEEGTLWFNTTVGKMFVYYNDGSSSQWVSAVGGIAGQSGTEGQMLIHDGTEWVAYDGGSRNLLYNGAMQVAQRGTSSTVITLGGYYTADRWETVLNALGTWTQTVEVDGPTGSGFTKSLKIECTTADAAPSASSLLLIRQRLEGLDVQGIKKGTASAESLTLSFWVKSNVTGTYIAALRDTDNTRYIAQSYTVSSSGAWEKKTLTFAGDTTGVLDNDNAASFELFLWLASGSDNTSGTLATSWEPQTTANRAVGQTNLASTTSNYWQITGVQLEAGTVATPFEHKSYNTELAECERYYQYYDLYGQRTNSSSNSSWLIEYQLNFRNRMRSSPSLKYMNNAGVENRVDALNTLGGTVSDAYGLEQYSGTSPHYLRMRFYQTAISYSGIALSNIRLDAEL